MRGSSIAASFLALVVAMMPPHLTVGFSLQMSVVPSSVPKTGRMPRKVLVVGGGIGGLSSAFDAKHNLRPEDEVTVLSDQENFYFTPSNPWVATRMRTPEEISLPLAKILPRHNVNFVHGKATQLDPQKQQLELQDGSSLPYDYLIIATGPRLAFEEIPGADNVKTTSVVSVCTTSHASHAAEQVDKLVEEPGPIVVGSAAGSSCFGPAYEFALLLHGELKKRGGSALLEKCPMTFVTAEPYIGHLGLQGAGESQKILEKMLTDKGIPFYTNAKIDLIANDHVSIIKVDESNKKIKIPSTFTMVIPPFRGQKLWKKVPKLTDEKGMIIVNEYQQSTAYPNIFGVGTCVSIPPLEKTLVPTGPPKTGYMIESQGTAAVKNIRLMIDYAEKHTNAGTDGPSLPELKHRALLNGLCITDFGNSGAIFLTLPQYPPRRTDITIQGRVATLAKLAFEKYFLHKVETGDTDPYYETYMLHLIGLDRVTSKSTK